MNRRDFVRAALATGVAGVVSSLGSADDSLMVRKVRTFKSFGC